MNLLIEWAEVSGALAIPILWLEFFNVNFVTWFYKRYSAIRIDITYILWTIIVLRVIKFLIHCSRNTQNLYYWYRNKYNTLMKEKVWARFASGYFITRIQTGGLYFTYAVKYRGGCTQYLIKKFGTLLSYGRLRLWWSCYFQLVRQFWFSVRVSSRKSGV